MTKILDKNLQVVNKESKIVVESEDTANTDSFNREILESYIRLKTNDNFDLDNVTSKFKTIIEANYSILIKILSYKKIYDCNLLTQALKRDFNKYLNCSFFKIKDVMYHPLNSSLIRNGVINNNYSYVDLIGRRCFIGVNYSLSSEQNYIVDGCCIITLEINNVLKHLMILFNTQVNYRYTIPQYSYIDDKTYKLFLDKIKNTQYDVRFLNIIDS